MNHIFVLGLSIEKVLEALMTNSYGPFLKSPPHQMAQGSLENSWLQRQSSTLYKTSLGHLAIRVRESHAKGAQMPIYEETPTGPKWDNGTSKEMVNTLY